MKSKRAPNHLRLALGRVVATASASVLLTENTLPQAKLFHQFILRVWYNSLSRHCTKGSNFQTTRARVALAKYEAKTLLEKPPYIKPLLGTTTHFGLADFALCLTDSTLSIGPFWFTVSEYSAWENSQHRLYVGPYSAHHKQTASSRGRSSCLLPSPTSTHQQANKTKIRELD